MTSIAKTGNSAHDANAIAAEATRQTSMVGITTNIAAINIDITYYRTLRNSAIANGLPASNFNSALRALGVYS
jgi:hypothetical protein